MEAVAASSHWFEIIQTVGILTGFLFSVAGLAYTAFEFRRQTKSILTSNRLQIVEGHRQLTLFRLSNPGLSRIKQTKVNLQTKPITDLEADWLGLKFLHFSACFYAIQNGQYEKPERLTDDIRDFFNLPLPAAAWNRAKAFHNAAFVRYVEGCLTNPSPVK